MSYRARVRERDAAQQQLTQSVVEKQELRAQLRQANTQQVKDAAAQAALVAQLEQLQKKIEEQTKERDDAVANIPVEDVDMYDGGNPAAVAAVAAAGGPAGWSLPPGYVKVSDTIYAMTEEAGKLGDGSSGTSVWRGFVGIGQPRPCAVKRMVNTHNEQADLEIEALLKIKDTRYIIQYYTKEQANGYIFLALELADGSLNDLTGKLSPPVKVDITKQMILGVVHLHRDIALSHRDIKPANVLYIKDNNGDIVIKLADLGFARVLDSSTAGASIVARSQGWQPAEVLDVFEAKTNGVDASPVLPKPADVFSLGVLIFWLFSNGVHPFGGGIKIDANIWDNNQQNVGIGKVDLLVEDLVQEMIHPEPAKRPRISDCEFHPLLWSSHDQLEFLKIVSDWLQDASFAAHPSAALLSAKLQAGTLKNVNWQPKVHPDLFIFWKAGAKVRNQHFSADINGLLRMLRNNEHHFDDFPVHLKALFGSEKLGVLSYFVGLFPLLLVGTFRVLIKNYFTADLGSATDKAYLKQAIKGSKGTIHIPQLNRWFEHFTVKFSQ